MHLAQRDASAELPFELRLHRTSISIDVYQKQRRSGYDNDGGDTNPDPDDNFSHTLIVVAGFSPRSRGNPNAGFSPRLL